jgi:anthranilate phosphoribosyltransferase
MTVFGIDGVDEISTTGKTILVRCQNGKVSREEVEPEDLGLKRGTADEISGSDPDENARLTAKILFGRLPKDDPRVQMVLANAAAGLVLCEKARTFRDGVEMASNIVSDGTGFQSLYLLVQFSGGDGRRLKNMV